MAKFLNGVNGPFMGNLGTITGSSWYGMPYIKARYRRRTGRVSDMEKQNRSKFSMAHFWLQPLLDFVRESFKNYSFRARGFNAAKSHLLKSAFEGTAPGIWINPALVKVSVGDLPLPDNITAEKSGEETIRFSWDPKIKDTHYLDQAMMLAYNIEAKHAFYRTTGQLRYTGEDTLMVVKGLKYHLYLAFNAADRSTQSDSVYLGEMQM